MRHITIGRGVMRHITIGRGVMRHITIGRGVILSLRGTEPFLDWL